ncbi:MAG: ribosomal-processing cysteine protease Prp [Bacilli bacterium]|nr:ribosomal-processing cysteine protease Prp [Bacilli bacterium]
MIKVIVENNKIEMSGHAYFDELGKDIVCASVSSIVITTINACIDIDEDSIYYEDLDNKIKIEILKEEEIIRKLINNMIFMLEGLEKDYPKNIKILRR